MLDFRPPKDAPALIWFAKLVMPFILKLNLHDMQVQVVGDGIERFKKLQGHRTVICPNHPNHNDPESMFTFSKMVGEDFNFLAAREIFDYNNGWNGWILQHLGVYSVVRGAADRESFRTTKNLLVSGRKKLVIFPEGEISSQNDTLMALECGVAQMSFWALDELQKQNPTEPILICPLALKYSYRSDIRNELENCLWRLEDRLGVKAKRDESLHVRLGAISSKLLQLLEKEYDYKSPPDATMNECISGLRGFILKNIAQYLQLPLSDKGSPLEWVRIVRNGLDDFVYEEDREFSAYEKKLHDQKAARIRAFYRDLDRVVNFISIYQGYTVEHSSQERFADVIDRFEKEVFGRASVKGPRLVQIDVGEPLSLLDVYAEYRNDKRVVLQKLTLKVTSQIATMLEALDRNRQSVLIS